nr:DUF2268 domain-containing putative Zn-dependent protease [Pontibacillus sp. HN14]
MLDKEYDHILSLVKDSLEKSSKMLPVGSTTNVYLIPFNPNYLNFMREMDGAYGLASSNVIMLFINPEYLKDNDDHIKYITAHEYQHTAHYSSSQPQQPDLIIYSLREGEADTFAQMLYPEQKPEWTKELTAREVDAIWEWAIKNRQTNDRNVFNEFVETGNSMIPKKSAYRLGYEIMQDFISRNPNVSVEDWSSMDPIEIINQTKYANKVKNE